MMAEYLDKDGLAYFWEQVKEYCDSASYLPLAGGTMSGELVVNGGDAAGSSKIVLASGVGNITNSGTATLFGFTSASDLTIGHSTYNTKLRGKASRPTYNGVNMALQSDVPTDYLPTSGGAMTGVIDASGTNNVIDFGTSGWFRGLTTFGGRFDIFGMSSPTTLQVGGTYPALSLKGKNARPTYNGSDLALKSDIPTEGISGSAPTLLWSGTLSSGGNVTVAASGGSAGCTGLGNISDYQWCVFDIDGYAAFVDTSSSALYFGYVWRTSSGTNSTGHIYATLSDNTLTLSGYQVYNLTTSGNASGTKYSIKNIYGLAKKTDIITS